MLKDFDSWNAEKKLVDKRIVDRTLFFHAREVWWCNAGLNIGVEVDGKNENFERPMLIIKKFNADLVWVLPLSTKDKNNSYYYKLHHEIIKSSVVLSQLKSMSTKRLLRKIGMISESDFREVIFRLQKILTIENPLAGVFSEAEATNN
jgi:mRNA interferase MazF